ncbi:MAG: aromatic aminobenezylarsenical efflux permease ArsG family transporter [Acidobacteriota bacterium]
MSAIWEAAPFLALWFGLLTSISPCPLATNVAALSYLTKEVRHPAAPFRYGLLYAAGRAAAYVFLAVFLGAGILSLLETAEFLQLEMARYVGPLLILVGFYLLLQPRLRRGGSGRWASWGERTARVPGLGPFLLGALFALSFCPVSAGLFFGSLLPLAVGAGSTVLLPLLFGFGSALPVIVLAAALATGLRRVGAAFGMMEKFERYARPFTALVFVLAGAYLVWAQWWRLP